MAESARQQVATPEPVGGPSAPAKNGATMIVACRVPHGMLLRTFDIVEENEVTRTGIEKIKKSVCRQHPESMFSVRGPGRGQSALTGLTQDQRDSLHPYGYAVTQGCPAKVWDDWFADNRLSPYVTRGDIFAETSMDRIRNRAAEYSRDPVEALTGLEPIDPENPARRVRGERGLRLARGDRA